MVLPVKCKASKAPTIDSGTAIRMMKGSMKLSNCAASTRKMNSTASTNTTPSAPLLSRNSRLTSCRSVA